LENDESKDCTDVQVLHLQQFALFIGLTLCFFYLFRIGFLTSMRWVEST